MQHILVCDDEEDIVAALKIYLEADGYCVHAAYTGADALKIVREEPVQLALMDIMMPGMDGITAMAKLREFSNIPVILLTAKSEDSDKILGLSVGADDYITKPFNPVEVLARVKSQLRRFLQLGAAVKAPSVISVGGIELDHDAKRVTLDGEPVALTPKEYDILYYLMQHPGKVYTPAELYSAVWNEAPVGIDNTVAVHIRHLREKLEIDPSNPRYARYAGHGGAAGMMTAEQYVGQPIRSLQTMLRTIAHADETLIRLVPDGIYGPNTVQAVREFQRQQELPVTGETDNATWDQIVAVYTRKSPAVLPAAPVRIRWTPNQVLPAGSRNSHLFLMQAMLQALGRFFVNAPAVRATGVHDAASVAAVRWLQKLSGLPQTGAIDQTTWAYLSGLYTLTTGTGDPTPPR